MTTKNVMLGIFVVAVFATGFMMGRFSSINNTFISDNQNKAEDSTSKSPRNDSVAGEAETIEGDTTISASNLTDGQKKMLSALGIDTESITVTPEMATCAEASLGARRMDEVINGATPSFTEGVKLVACYK